MGRSLYTDCEVVALICSLDGEYREVDRGCAGSSHTLFRSVVLAKLLGLEARTDWRNCGETDAQQTADAAAFRKAFKKYQ